MKPIASLMISLVFLLAACQKQPPHYDAETARELKRLDSVILLRPYYEKIKLKEIDSLKKELARTRHNPNEYYGINEQLGDQYLFYQSDSAITYMQRCIDLAEEMNDKNLKVRSHAKIAIFYSFNARTYDAHVSLMAIRDTTDLDYQTQIIYLTAEHRWYRDLLLKDNNSKQRNDFRQKERYYCQAIISLSDDPIIIYRYKYYNAVANKRYPDAIAWCDSILSRRRSEQHEYAQAANHKANIYEMTGNHSQQLLWMIHSAISDIQTATKDYAALEVVAETLFDMGEVKTAMYFMRLVIEDTKFFHSSLRAMRNINALPQIESAYYQHSRSIHKMWIYIACIMVLLAAVVTVFMLYILRQNRHLEALRATLSESNNRLHDSAESLKHTNARLVQLNARIADANNIKEAYIGTFMKIFSEQINHEAETQRHISKLIREDRFDKLRQQYGQIDLKYDELKEFYKLFDSVLLHLYPTFVADFNAMLQPDARINVRKNDSLTTELRIFALIRLGFNDTTQIAALLHCSINTVYNYRSRLGRQAINTTSSLEQQIMQIGIPETKNVNPKNTRP